MQPTVTPWWRQVQQTRRVLLPRAHYRAHNIHFNWSRPRNRDITLYFGRDDPTPIFRFENALGQSRPFPTKSPWPDRYPLDMEPWRQPLPTTPDLKSDLGAPASSAAGVSDVDGTATAPEPTETAERWESAARGWIVGTVLLIALVLIVRAMERCLDRRLLKVVQGRTVQWPRPILAAAGLDTSNIDVRLENSDAFQSEPIQTMPNDLPPPYSECANVEVRATDADSSKLEITQEEPPPPYSACYVSFLNPKDGIPSVHLYRRNLADTGSTSADTTSTVVSNGDIGNSSVAASNSEFRDHNIVNANVELVFDNGRVIERTKCANNLMNRNVQTKFVT